MARKQSVGSYLQGLETMRRRELEWGSVVREAPGPTYRHQSVLTQLTVLLDRHVRAFGLGRVVVSPIDVILDEPRALVVQPDLVFIAEARRAIVQDQVWGPPDLAVEVLSPRTLRRDRIKKLDWYRRYAVQEYWIVNPGTSTVEVYALQAMAHGGPYLYRSGDILHSTVMPDLKLPVAEIFAE